MTPRDPPRIVAAIGGEDQRAAMLYAADQFAYCVGAALGTEWPVRLRLIGLDDADVPPGIALVASPIDAPDADASPSWLEAQWAARIDRFRAAGHSRILLCNRFRGVTAGGVERARRLNMVAVRLSRAQGVEIVDIDRLFALCGGRTIAAAPQGGEVAAAQLTGHAIAEAILQGDLGDALDPATQARASGIHGQGRDVRPLIARFLRDPAAA